MSIARNLHTAVLLPDGKVLVAGGRTESTGTQETTARTELYDPAQDAWLSSGMLATPRDHHAATRLRDGRVLVSGGSDVVSVGLSFGGQTNTAELWDPQTGKWADAAPMSTSRAFHASTLLADGRVLITGGDTAAANTAAEMFDPETESWRRVAPMRTPRGLHAAVLLRGGRVLVAGGYGLDEAALKSAEIFDPKTGRWTRTGPLPSPHGHPLVARLPGGRVLVAGGQGADGEPTAAAAIYRPRLGRWRRVAPMDMPREAAMVALLPNGDVLVVSGRVAAAIPGVPEVLSTTAEIFDVTQGRWHPAGRLTVARTNATATTLSDGRVLVVGGWNEQRRPEASAEIFSLS